MPAKDRAGSLLESVERYTSLTPSGLAAAGLILAGWIIARLIGSRVLYLMVYGGAFVLVLSVAAARRKPVAEAIRSDLPARLRERQTVSVELTLKSKRRLSTLIVEESLHPLLGKDVTIPVPLLDPGRELSYRYSFTPSLRGVYDIGPVSVVWSDPFGLVRRRAPLLESQKIIVHPSTEMVHDRVLSREWEDPPVRPPISKPWPTGFEFYGMRDYVPGDDPRRIVWRAVARTGRYLVREAEQGITDRVTIIIDNEKSQHSEETPSNSFETAIRAASSLGVKHLKDGFSVMVESSSGRVVESLRGQRMRVRFLDEMARLEMSTEPLTTALHRILAEPRKDTHNILIGPRLDSEGAGILRLLLERGGSVVFVHIQTDEFDGDSVHRAAAMGCQVVELPAGSPLETVFRKTVGAGMRR